MDTTTPPHVTDDCKVQKIKRDNFQKKQTAFMHTVKPDSESDDDRFEINCPSEEECETYNAYSGSSEFDTSTDETSDEFTHNAWDSYYEDGDDDYMEQCP